MTVDARKSVVLFLWINNSARSQMVLVIVRGDEDRRCPTIWPGVLSRLVWRFEDPAAAEGPEEQRVQKFRDVRDQIEQSVKDWLATVLRPAPATPPTS